MTYLVLFWEFFKIGLFAVGGGAATIPFLSELPARFDWFTGQQLIDFIAISESTPGPIGVNMATFAGHSAAGVLGGIIATVGLVTPSVIIVLIISRFLKSFGESKTVKGVFYGIRPAVSALILNALLGIMEIVFLTGKAEFLGLNITLVTIFLSAFALMQLKPLKKLHPAVWMIAASAVGIALKL